MSNSKQSEDDELESVGGPNQPPGQSHADNYDPENTPNRNLSEEGPSGENTKNNGVRGGGLWTSGGQVTIGSGINDGEYGRPQPNREATPEQDDDNDNDESD